MISPCTASWKRALVVLGNSWKWTRYDQSFYWGARPRISPDPRSAHTRPRVLEGEVLHSYWMWHAVIEGQFLKTSIEVQRWLFWQLLKVNLPSAPQFTHVAAVQQSLFIWACVPTRCYLSSLLQALRKYSCMMQRLWWHYWLKGFEVIFHPLPSCATLCFSPSCYLGQHSELSVS